MKKWMVVTLASAGAAAGIFLLASAGTDQQAGGDGRADTHALAAPTQAAGSAQVQPAPPSPWAGSASSSTVAMGSPLSTMTPPQFAADSRGQLVLNADTHANLEKLLLEENPAALQAGLDKASKTLPPRAASELKVLTGQFQQYAKALTHTIPPETAPETEPERLKMLDTLHALRVSYLGAEAAQAMFGEEEATTRKLIRLMAAQDDPNLTSEQKAERAQEMLNSLRQQTPPPAS
jgi:lipase chaperone LimK